MLATRSSAVLALVLVVGCREEPGGGGGGGGAEDLGGGGVDVAEDLGGSRADADVGPHDADDDDGFENCDCPGEVVDEDEEVSLVAENTDSLCSDGVDNDSDGDIDCDDSDCVDDLRGDHRCQSDEQLCEWGWSGCDWVGGLCVCAPLGSTASFIRDLAIPPSAGDAACCFDFDGDGDIDNGLARLAELLRDGEHGIDSDRALRDAVATDTFAVVLDWGHGDIGNGFWLYLTSNDLDGDGEPDQDFATRAAGDGVFRILPASFDPWGVRTQFNAATDNGDEFTAGPSLIRLPLPLDDADPSSAIDIVVERASVAGEYFEDERGRWSVDHEYEVDAAAVTYGGWKLGGFVSLDTIGAAIDDAGRACACAGLTADAPLVTYGDDGTRYHLECVQTPASGCTDADGVVCANIVAICELLPALVEAGINDIDMDGNGVGDSMSVGLWLSAVGATFSDPPVLTGE